MYNRQADTEEKKEKKVIFCRKKRCNNKSNGR